jgi:hypothetical protein
LDTPVKRTLWFHIIPLLEEDDQEYCKRKLSLTTLMMQRTATPPPAPLPPPPPPIVKTSSPIRIIATNCHNISVITNESLCCNEQLVEDKHHYNNFVEYENRSMSPLPPPPPPEQPYYWSQNKTELKSEISI